MDYGKREKYIILSGLNSAEFFCMLKTQMPCTLVFSDNTGKREFIDLGARTIEGTEQSIVCTFDLPTSSDAANKGKRTVAYTKLLDIVREYQATKKLSVEILNVDFRQKESIISLWGHMNPDVIANCIFVDYDADLSMFSLINKPKNNKPEKLYYFEDTEELLVFSKDGPKLYKKFTNIEDILC